MLSTPIKSFDIIQPNCAEVLWQHIETCQENKIKIGIVWPVSNATAVNFLKESFIHGFKKWEPSKLKSSTGDIGKEKIYSRNLGEKLKHLPPCTNTQN